jgi:hypothetical protein
MSRNDTNQKPLVRTSVADPDPFDTDPAFQFDTDPDPYRFKEVMYLKWYLVYIFTLFSLSVGPTRPTQKVGILC